MERSGIGVGTASGGGMMGGGELGLKMWGGC